MLQSPVCLIAPNRAEHPYQGLSIDFSFSGMVSSNNKRQQDYKRINRETVWILVTQHFTDIHHGDSRISKAAAVLSLKHFLAQYNPTFSNKYVHMGIQQPQN